MGVGNRKQARTSAIRLAFPGDRNEVVFRHGTRRRLFDGVEDTLLSLGPGVCRVILGETLTRKVRRCVPHWRQT